MSVKQLTLMLSDEEWREIDEIAHVGNISH